MKNKLFYTFRSGKNIKLTYYARNVIRRAVPRCIFRCRLESALREIESRPDRDYIRSRVDYYCRLLPGATLPADAPMLGQHKPARQKVYFFDTYEFTRWFDDSFRWGFCPGDVTFIPEIPSIVKSRPIEGDNANSVVLKLDKIRHFIFVRDKKPFTEKQDRVVFRGKVYSKQQRVDFMNRFFGNPMFDAGDVGRDARPEWTREKLTIAEHLDFKFIMAIEGNDVASNLKWIMSSNSIAVMPRPTYETWFMEGTLVPDVHYIEVKPDFSDLVERVEYYMAHPDAAQKIIDNANRYAAQFTDKKREKLISLAVLDKYFRCTGQK